MSIFTVITILGIVQNIFYGVILFTIDRNNKRANKILAILLLLIGSSIPPILFFGIEEPPVINFLFKVVPDVRFLFGPFLFFYTHALVTRNFRFRWKHIFHFLPYYVIGVISVFFRFQSYQTWLSLKVFLTFFCYTHVFLYSFLCIISVRKHIAGI